MSPRLVGERFDGGMVPLEVLRDLAVLEELVIDVAKWKFLQAHPGRKRSPGGFADRIELRLTGVAAGSAIPQLVLVLLSAALPGFEDEKPYLDDAHEAIVSAIDAAGQGERASPHLPSTALSLFDKLGRSLRPDEAIEFDRPDGSGVARFDQIVRRRLTRESPGNQEMTDHMVLRGQVPEADQEARTFHLMLVDGRKVKAPIDEVHHDEIMDGFSGYRAGQWVEVRGVVRTDRNGRPMSFESLQRVVLLDALDIAVQIDRLRTLKPGWLDGRGLAPAAAELDWLVEWFGRNLPPTAPQPHIYPTPEGGVQAEWTLATREVTLEIDVTRRVAQWHALDMATDAEEHDELMLDEPAAVARLLARLTTGEPGQ